jgi:alcohol dehydrogenase class IV
MRLAASSIFTFYLPTKVIHGPGSLRETVTQFKMLGGTRALVVTDKADTTNGNDGHGRYVRRL